MFLKVLEPMKLGRLEVTLPDGAKRVFGSHAPAADSHVAHLHVRSPNFFKRCVLFGDIGFGEAFSAREFESDNLTQVLRWMILNWENNPGVTESRVSSFGVGVLKLANRIGHLLRDNDLNGSVRNISAHYDLGNDFFATFLDQNMLYSSADFSGDAKTLEAAQLAKLDRLATSIQVQAGDHVLEIGGGWGGFAVHLAKKYGAKVTTITVSKEQLAKIQQRVRDAGVEHLVEAKFLDYRKVVGQFDKIVSVEMLEAVGHKHLPSFFSTCERCLKPNGLVGLQVITSADCRYDQVRRGVDWIQKHIFPGSLIPSLGALSDAARDASRLQPFSLHDMGQDYAVTLKTWRDRFNAAQKEISALGFDDQFLRAWNYYFSYCEAAFAERHISVVQLVYTRPNNSMIR